MNNKSFIKNILITIALLKIIKLILKLLFVKMKKINHL
jgi:hypothetical protein